MNAMPRAIKAFSPQDINLCNSYYLNVTQKMVDFLNTFNPDKLLFNFRVTAGLPNKKASISYGGWENSRIGGHTMGHYLSGAAQAVARGYGECKGADGLTLKARLEYIINSLEECQNTLGTGFIFGATLADSASPELQFDKLERGDYNDTWVPWYTMHKIVAGLVEAFIMTKNQTALAVAQNLGEWIYNRTSKWTEQVRDTVLRVEFGGMNDCLYELYKCSFAQGYKASEHFLTAAHVFDEEWLFSHVKAIVNRHANTQIPKFVGAANRSMILFEKALTEPKYALEAEAYLSYCRNFWDEVVNHHTYITGGNSECEHFGLPDILDAERSNTNCETCNTYNMLKLSRLLFMMTGERKYADYYENTFLNAIMASVNPLNGTTTYFQPMATGCFKTYCNPDVDKNFFWCCTGTGLENFTKLGDSFYFHDEQNLFVNIYVSSSVIWKEKSVKITQKTDIPETDFAEFQIEALDELENTTENSTDAKNQAENVTCVKNPAEHGGKKRSNSCLDFTLALRLPDWLSDKALVSINDAESVTVDACNSEMPVCNGYLFIKRMWKSCDRIKITLPMSVKSYSLADSLGRTFGFKYGPVVLAAELGADSNMKLGYVGAQCDVSVNKIVGGVEMPLTGNYGGTSNLNILETEIIKVKGESVEEFMKNPSAHFDRLADSLTQNSKLFERLDDSSAKSADSSACECAQGSHLPVASASPRFRLKDTDFPGDFIFSPYNRLLGQRYGIYWIFVATDEQKHFEKQSAWHPDDSETYIEGIGIGYGAQTEGNAHTYPYMQESDSVADPHELTRYANAGGYFSYEFAVKPDKKNYLVCTFLKADNGKSLKVSALPESDSESFSKASGSNSKATLIADIILNYSGSGEKYSLRFLIPEELTNLKCGKEKSSTESAAAEEKLHLRICFASSNQESSARLCAPVKTVYTD